MYNLTIFPFILIPMIGLSDSYKFDNNVPVSNNGPFDNSNTVNNMTTNSYENNFLTLFSLPLSQKRHPMLHPTSVDTHKLFP